MPVITGTVGRGGNNRVHDVAVIQAALRNAKIPGAGGPFWSGRIDGRKSPALDEAIGAFQQAARVPVTGRIGQSGTDANKLESVQPSSHKAMRAVAGTAAVWRTSARAKRFAEVAKAAEASPFPKAERGALAAIAQRCAQSFGLGVELQDAAVTADGRFRARMGVPDIEWLDASGTRFQKGAAAPADVTRATARAGQGNPTWRTETQPRDGALLELTSMRAIPALAGPPTLTSEALETFGLTARPKDQFSQACIAGCAKLVEAGNLDDGDRDDFDTMAAALELAAPSTAKAVRGSIQLAQVSPGPSLMNQTWVNPTGLPKRTCDPEGCGAFGASRIGGRQHDGVDFETVPGQDVFSPTDGTFSRNAYTTRIDPNTGRNYPGIEIQLAPNIMLQMFYLDPYNFAAGQAIKAGDRIGQAVDIRAGYGARITNHIHMEIEDRSFNPKQFIDPTNLIP